MLRVVDDEQYNLRISLMITIPHALSYCSCGMWILGFVFSCRAVCVFLEITLILAFSLVSNESFLTFNTKILRRKFMTEQKVVQT